MGAQILISFTSSLAGKASSTLHISPYHHELKDTQFINLSTVDHAQLKSHLNAPGKSSIRVLNVNDNTFPTLLLHIGAKADLSSFGRAAILKNYGAIALNKAKQQGYQASILDWDQLKTCWQQIYGGRLKTQDLSHVLLGALMTDYQYVKPYQKQASETKRSLVVLSKKDRLSKTALEKLFSIQAAVNLVRDMANEPSNLCTPSSFAKKGQVLFKNISNVSTKILSKAELKHMGMNLLLSVNAGSEHPACLLEVTYRTKKKNAPKIALVGKGVTFDTGGYCVKPYPYISGMKHDMAGGATVLASIYAAASLKLPIHIKAFIPLTENLISGKAVKPGDVIKSYSGKTVEIEHTDAEGRLILADALAYAQKWQPDYMINAATLTGAVLVALGRPATGVMGNSPRLIQFAQKCAHNVGERLWELPLFPEFKSELKSDVADLRNVAIARAEAGTCIAGVFLSEFVSKETKWMHLDIAATSDDNKTRAFYPPKGASGAMILTLIEMLEHISEL